MKTKRTPDEARIHRNKLARDRRANKKQAQMAAEAPPVFGFRENPLAGETIMENNRPLPPQLHYGSADLPKEATMEGDDDFDDGTSTETDDSTQIEEAPKQRRAPRAPREKRAALTGQQVERLNTIFAVFRKMNLSGFQGTDPAEFLTWAQSSPRASKTLGLVSYTKESASKAAGGDLLRLDLQPMVATLDDVVVTVRRGLDTFGIQQIYDDVDPNYVLIQI